jgi:hypothetical protein
MNWITEENKMQLLNPVGLSHETHSANLQNKLWQFNSKTSWISTRVTAKQVWRFSWTVDDLHNNYCNTRVGNSIDPWIYTRIACETSVAVHLTCGSQQELLQKQVWQSSWPVDLNKSYCKKQVCQFSWPVGLHKSYCKNKCISSVDLWVSTRVTCKTSVAIQLTCGSQQELLQKQVCQFSWPVGLQKSYLQNKCGNSVDLWVSTRVTCKNKCGNSVDPWVFTWVNCKNKCGSSVDLWISTRVTVKQVWQFNWPADLHKRYWKTSVAIHLTCGSPQELLQNKWDNSIDLRISTIVTANNIRRRSLQNNYSGQKSA